MWPGVEVRAARALPRTRRASTAARAHDGRPGFALGKIFPEISGPRPRSTPTLGHAAGHLVLAFVLARVGVAARIFPELADPRPRSSPCFPTHPGGAPAGITCFDPDAAKTTTAEVEQWATSLENQIAEEERCRATPACMGARIAEQICPVLDERRETAAQISTEKRNPAGVVNLAVLHDLGQKLQYEDATIARLKAEFATAARNAKLRIKRFRRVCSRRRTCASTRVDPYSASGNCERACTASIGPDRCCLRSARASSGCRRP